MTELHIVRDVSDMRRLMRQIEEGTRAARINANQCRLVQTRIGAIVRIVLMLPEPRPSPRLLTVLKSAAHLVALMGGAAAVTEFLPRRFTASELFAALFVKLNGVWALQSTLAWPKEEAAAAEKDAAHGIALLRDAMESPVAGTSSALAMLWNIVRRGRMARCSGASALSDVPASTAGTSAATTASATSLAAASDDTVMMMREPIASEEVGARHGSLDADDLDELTTYFRRRRHMSGWKLQFEELAPCTACCIAPPLLPPSVPAVASHGALVPAPRWSVLDGFSFLGHHVVVKEVADSGLLTPAMIEAFVLDMASRFSWCHPNVCNFEGAYCERFEHRGGGDGCSGIGTTTLHSRDRVVVAAWPEPPRGVSMHALGATSSAAVAAVSSGTPYAALGLVMSRVPPSMLPLSYLLFGARHRFSTEQAVEITMQVGDALQYVLYSAADVNSTDVVRAWTMVSASNVFVGATTTTIDVLLSPHIALIGGPVNRWMPHPDAAHAECYVLAQLLAAIVTGVPPYSAVTDQRVLQAIFAEATDAPPGYDEAVFERMHPALRVVLLRGLRLRRDEVDATSDPTAAAAARGYPTLQCLRKDLLALVEQLTSSAAPARSGADSLQRLADLAASPLAPIDSLEALMVDDYGSVHAHSGGAAGASGAAHNGAPATQKERDPVAYFGMMTPFSPE